jgi:hypothetical protein
MDLFSPQFSFCLTDYCKSLVYNMVRAAGFEPASSKVRLSKFDFPKRRAVSAPLGTLVLPCIFSIFLALLQHGFNPKTRQLPLLVGFL